jgi:hypothetical protein
MNWRAHRGLAIILALFLILATIYSIVTPIFEAGDEIWHYPFVRHLATGNGLPIQDPNIETLWEQEGGQPPLYYAIAALATFWIDTRDLPERLWLNPHAKIGIPLAFGNKNMIVHTSAEDFPWQGTTLAVHLIRFLSIILSAITVALTYLLALEMSSGFVIASAAKQSPHHSLEIASDKDRPRNDNHSKTLATFAAAIVAFNPMFVFISASVNNDNLATMLATLSLVLLAQLITRGATFPRFVVLGIVLGLGALTKVSLLGLLIVAAVVFAYLLWKSRAGEQERERKGENHPLAHSPTHPLDVVRGSLICAAIVITIAFWWYVRNWILYGDLLAFNVWVQIAGGRPTPVTLTSLFNEFQGFRISFWGNFGGVNLIAHEWVYFILDVFTLLAIIGLVVGLARQTLPWLLWLPIVWFALIMLSLVRWTWLTMASQGRLIFPAIAAVAVLFAAGLCQFQISNFRFQIIHHASRITFYVLRFIFPILLFIFASIAPFTIIAPAYTLPLRFTDESTIQNRLGITFNHQAELVGYHLLQKSVKPGEELPLTMYWRAYEPITEDFSIYIRLFDAEGKSIGRWEAFPGGGLYPTRLWQPGEIIADQYRIPVSLDARGPNVGKIEVGLFRRVPLETLVARDPRGNVVTPIIARFKIAGQSKVQIENPVDYKFGASIALAGYSFPQSIAPGSTLNVKLFWRALKIIDEDYTVFVHLVDANGKIIAQKDAPPQNGAYPTSFWETGEIIEDDYALTIPRDATPGDYRIVIGLYHDGNRLPTRDGDHIELSIRVGN